MASDAAYQTLRRLLAAPPANRAHVDLLDRHALYGAVGHYLAVMSLLNVSEFASVLVASPAFAFPLGSLGGPGFKIPAGGMKIPAGGLTIDFQHGTIEQVNGNVNVRKK